MVTKKNIPQFASAAAIGRYLSSPGLGLARHAANDVPSMRQAFARIRTAIVGFDAGSKAPIRTVRAARRFIETAAGGNCCVVAEDEDGLSLELNCASLELADLLSSDGLVRIGRNTFKVERDSVTLIDGAVKRNSSVAAVFRELGYPQITDGTASGKKTAAKVDTVWRLEKRVTQLNRKIPAYGYRVTFTVGQYVETNALGDKQSYCRIDVSPQVRHWLNLIPIWVPIHVKAISIGGAFSGPKSPQAYYLTNPFNHVVKYSVASMKSYHWLDPDPDYQVDSCSYDCSVYPYDGGRVDADVWK